MEGNINEGDVVIIRYEGPKGGPEADLTENVPKPQSFSVGSGASDRVHGSTVTLTKSAACAQKFAPRQRGRPAEPSKAPYQHRQNPISALKHCLGNNIYTNVLARVRSVRGCIWSFTSFAVLRHQTRKNTWFSSTGCSTTRKNKWLSDIGSPKRPQDGTKRPQDGSKRGPNLARLEGSLALQIHSKGSWSPWAPSCLQ